MEGLAALRDVLDATDPPDRRLVVTNRTQPDPIQRMLERTFSDQQVAVAEQQVPDVDSDVVMLLEDGDVVATDPLQDLMDAFLLVNSDRYRTGAAGFEEWTVPSVLTNMDGVVFDLRGYPASNKEKLLLIVISRFIEGRALAAGRGRLRSTFQRLSRIDDEFGTRQVYRRLSETDLDLHLYGVGDHDGPALSDIDATVHAGRSDVYRRSWCVVFIPPDEEADHAALVAVETDQNVWRGTWTFDADRVRDIDERMERVF